MKWIISAPLAVLAGYPLLAESARGSIKSPPSFHRPLRRQLQRELFTFFPELDTPSEGVEGRIGKGKPTATSSAAPKDTEGKGKSTAAPSETPSDKKGKGKGMKEPSGPPSKATSSRSPVSFALPTNNPFPTLDREPTSEPIQEPTEVENSTPPSAPEPSESAPEPTPEPATAEQIDPSPTPEPTQESTGSSASIASPSLAPIASTATIEEARDESTPEPTLGPTRMPTEQPAPSPTQVSMEGAPTSEPNQTPESTANPTPSPTPEPTREPMPEPTSEPPVAAEPTENSTPNLTLEPTQESTGASGSIASPSPVSITSAPTPEPEPASEPTPEPTRIPTSTEEPALLPTPPLISDPAPSITSSPAPVASPAQLPSSSSSVDLTASPSGLQSVSLPSLLPTNILTAAPSQLPSLLSSSVLSSSPSAPGTPSQLPSLFPSSTPGPSVSASPSSVLFDIKAVDKDGNPVSGDEGDNSAAGIVSECFSGPEDGDSAVSLLYDFSYVAILEPESDAMKASRDIELLLHKRLGLEFMDCNKLERRLNSGKSISGAQFTPFMLSSLPVDAVSADTGCVSTETEEGLDCHVVNAGFTMRMYQGSNDESVLFAVSDWLAEELPSGRLNAVNDDVRELKFRGISEGSVFSGIPTSDEIINDPSSAVDAGTAPRTNPKIVGGSLAVGVAALGAIAIAFFALRKRRRNNKYLEQLDDLDDKLELESIGEATSDDTPKGLATIFDFNNAAFDDLDIADMELDKNTKWSHDLKTCKSSMCEICQAHKLQMPTFIPAAQMTADIERDLAPDRKRSSSPRTYHQYDTVAF